MTLFVPWFEFWVWLLTSAVAFGALVLYDMATIRYRFTAEALEIVALGIPFRTIPYAAIEAAAAGGSLWHEHWVTYRLHRRVTLRLREGGRAVVITPADPQAFLREMRDRLSRHVAKDAT